MQVYQLLQENTPKNIENIDMNWYMNQRNCQTNIFFHEKLVMKIRMKCPTESRDFTSDL